MRDLITHVDLGLALTVPMKDEEQSPREALADAAAILTDEALVAQLAGRAHGDLRTVGLAAEPLGGVLDYENGPEVLSDYIAGPRLLATLGSRRREALLEVIRACRTRAHLSAVSDSNEDDLRAAAREALEAIHAARSPSHAGTETYGLPLRQLVVYGQLTLEIPDIGPLNGHSEGVVREALYGPRGRPAPLDALLNIEVPGIDLEETGVIHGIRQIRSRPDGPDHVEQDRTGIDHLRHTLEPQVLRGLEPAVRTSGVDSETLVVLMKSGDGVLVRAAALNLLQRSDLERPELAIGAFQALKGLDETGAAALKTLEAAPSALSRIPQGLVASWMANLPAKLRARAFALLGAPPRRTGRG